MPIWLKTQWIIKWSWVCLITIIVFGYDTLSINQEYTIYWNQINQTDSLVIKTFNLR